MREVSPALRVSPPLRERNGGDTPPLRFPLVPESRRNTTATLGDSGETRSNPVRWRLIVALLRWPERETARLAALLERLPTERRVYRIPNCEPERDA